MFRRICYWSSMGLFLTAGVMCYAFVFDCEPLSAEKHYELERDVYNHSDLAAYGEFPAFDAWLSEQDRKEERFHEWLANVADQVGEASVDAFEFTIGQSVQNTREGSAAEAPAFEFNADNR